jgi:hypothetical protein
MSSTKNGKTVTLLPREFLGRYLAHVLPDGFVKIRHYGLMAPSNATTKLQVARNAIERQRAGNVNTEPLTSRGTPPLTIFTDWREALRLLTGVDLTVCPGIENTDYTSRITASAERTVRYSSGRTRHRITNRTCQTRIRPVRQYPTDQSTFP